MNNVEILSNTTVVSLLNNFGNQPLAYSIASLLSGRKLTENEYIVIQSADITQVCQYSALIQEIINMSNHINKMQQKEQPIEKGPTR